MPAIKSIQINPDLLSMSSKKSKTRKNRKREKKRKPKPHIKPNTLKKALLRRIKEHSNKEKKRFDMNQKDDNDSNKEFNNDFKQHLDYLSNLSIQHKHRKKKKNKTLKTRPTVSDVKIHTELPPELHEKSVNNQTIAKSNEPPIVLKQKVPELVKEPIKQTVTNPIATTPPYSCLKGGSKPTYREWKRLTQKNSESSSSNSSNSIDKNNDEKQHVKLDELRERIKINNEKHKVVKPKRTYKKRTIKRKYKFGKNKGKISVLVKNNKTRKLVQNEVEVLRTAPMKEVKEYLKRHYLYKSGSNAPNDVLRKTYMDAHLSGEINNKSTENLVHNFVNS